MVDFTVFASWNRWCGVISEPDYIDYIRSVEEGAGALHVYEYWRYAMRNYIAAVQAASHEEIPFAERYLLHVARKTYADIEGCYQFIYEVHTYGSDGELTGEAARTLIGDAVERLAAPTPMFCDCRGAP